MCDGPCEYWNERASLPLLRAWFSQASVVQRQASKLMLAAYDPYHYLMKRFGARVLIDSSKQTGWIRKRARTLRLRPNTRALLVYLIRDGRAVVNAYNRKYPQRGLDSIAKRWVEKTEHMQQRYRQFPESDRMTVRYEDLATDPEATLKHVCKAADLDFTPAMLSYWACDHHLLLGNGGTKLLIFRYREKYGRLTDDAKDMMEHSKHFYSASYYEKSKIGIQLDERWKRELSEEQLEIIDWIAGPTNRALGYEQEHRNDIASIDSVARKRAER
jgi:hypothetical protein